MINYYDNPFIVTEKAGIDDEDEFNALIKQECGEDEIKQHEFFCQWIQEWLQKNDLRFVLAEITSESEMAEFMCFVADYIEAFDYSLQNMILDHAFQIGGAKIEAAEQKMIQADLRPKGTPPSEPSFQDIRDMEEEETPDYESILNEELQSFTGEQLLALLSSVFGCDQYDEISLPEIEDGIAYLENILSENGWTTNVFWAIVEEIQRYKATL